MCQGYLQREGELFVAVRELDALQNLVWYSGFGIWGLGFGVWGVGFGVWGLGFRVWDSGFGVCGLG